VTEKGNEESVWNDDRKCGGRKKMERPDVGRLDAGFVANSDGLDRWTDIVKEEGIVDKRLGCNRVKD
jgi:hypothetical protein